MGICPYARAEKAEHFTAFLRKHGEQGKPDLAACRRQDALQHARLALRQRICPTSVLLQFFGKIRGNNLPTRREVS